MADWPTWEKAHDCVPYTEQISDDGDLLSKMEGGYVATRRRYSRARTTYEFTTTGLSANDLTTARSFISAHRTTGSFVWNTKTVRFKDIPKLTKSNNIWSMTVRLIEV